MKMIAAVIRPSKVDEVCAALGAVGVGGMTLTEVKGHGRQKRQTEIYRGAECEVTFLPKIRIEIGVGDDDENRVVQAIQTSTVTGKISDGKIFVSDVGRVVRIRTGETGVAAL